MRRALLFATFLAMTLAAGAAKASCGLPFNIQNGRLADAAQVMANFNALAGCIASGPAGVSAVTAGTSGTVATLNTQITLISWSSTAVGARTQHIPACVVGLSGFIVIVKDTAYVASTSNYTITPAAGTIDGQSSARMNSDGESLWLQCNGPYSDWTII